jgi:hypothetical protein
MVEASSSCTVTLQKSPEGVPPADEDDEHDEHVEAPESRRRRPGVASSRWRRAKLLRGE